MASICLTFDDLFLKNWIWALPILKKFEAKVTFFAGPIEMLGRSEVYRLKKLQAAGHEIGYHTMTHPKLLRFLKTHSKDDYLEQEILAGLDVMHQHGFEPKSFAYPFFKSDAEINEKLKPIFTFIRGAGAARNAKQTALRIYKACSADHVYHNLGQIDFAHSKFPISRFAEDISYLRGQDGMAVFTGHNIIAQPIHGGFHMTHADLEVALRMISEAGLHMETCQSALSKLK